MVPLILGNPHILSAKWGASYYQDHPLSPARKPLRFKKNMCPGHRISHSEFSYKGLGIPNPAQNDLMQGPFKQGLLNVFWVRSEWDYSLKGRRLGLLSIRVKFLQALRGWELHFVGRLDSLKRRRAATNRQVSKGESGCLSSFSVFFCACLDVRVHDLGVKARAPDCNNCGEPPRSARARSASWSSQGIQ